MAFFEELGKTLSDTGREVATKARALTEAIQLKSQIGSERSRLESAYTNIGRKYCELHDSPDDDVYSADFETVRSCRERIQTLETELWQTEGAGICAECGARVPKDSSFCGKCGAAVREWTAGEKDAAVSGEFVPAEREAAAEGGREVQDIPAGGLAKAEEDAFENQEEP